jgi:hypothetical protein
MSRRSTDPGLPTHVVSLSRAAYRLSTALAVAAALATAPTVFGGGILRGPAVMNGSARGTALVMLAVGVPGVVAAMLAARRGSSRAILVWLGSASYLLYNATLLLFATPFNHLFLLYVATFALGLWAIVAVLGSLDVERFGRLFKPGLPTRAIAVYTWVVVALNAMAWLKAIVPALLTDGPPSFLVGTGLTTFALYVEDLAVWLPVMGLAAYWLWRRMAWGYLVVGSGLVLWTVESVGVAVDQAFGHAADPASTVAAAAAVPMFAVLALVTSVPVMVILRHLPRTPAARQPHPAYETSPLV